MITLRYSTEIKDDRHLMLNLPPEVPVGAAEVIVTISPCPRDSDTLVQSKEFDSAEFTRRHAELVRLMEADGTRVRVPAPAERPPKNWLPLLIDGEPLSETVIKDRR